MSTLLEKAKNIKSPKRKRRKVSSEEEELVIAWFNEEITTNQFAEVTGQPLTGWHVQGRCASILRDMIAKNKKQIV